MEDLPKAPEWRMMDITIDGYPTVKPMVLFYRDPLECAQALVRNPIFEGMWNFIPRRIYQDPDRQNRIYGEWMTSDGAWAAQVCFFPFIDTNFHPNHNSSSPPFRQVELSLA